MKALILIAVGAIAVIFVPVVFIWAMNTLFGLAIAYTAKMWFAALIILGILTGSSHTGD